MTGVRGFATWVKGGGVGKKGQALKWLLVLNQAIS